MQPNPFRPQPRSERLPVDVIRRVMPTPVPDDIPRDPTLLETLTQGFYDEVSTGDVSTRIEHDGKQR